MQTHSHEQEHSVETRGHVIDGLARYYDVIVGLITLGREKRMRTATLKLVDLQPGSQVLEVGCGTGTLILAANQHMNNTGRAIGIDPSAEMIQQAQVKAEKAGSSVEFRRGVAEKLQFEDNIFDVVLSSLVMHHLPDEIKPQALTEMYRVLKPGGQFVIVDLDPQPFSLAGMLHGHTAQSTSHQNKNASLLEAAGFDNLEAGR